MKLFKALNKYRTSFSLQKSDLYKRIEEHKKSIVEEGFSYQIKNIEMAFMMEILCQGIENKVRIEEAYYTFVSENYDILDHITYQERQKLINQDIAKATASLTYFMAEEYKILIPFFESFINQRYIEESQMLALKQHREYVEKYPREVENSIKLYGLLPYISDFSSLQFLGQDDIHYYFYFSENKTIYIFDEDGLVYEEFSIVDQYHAYEPMMEEIKKVLQLLLATKDDQEVVDFMHEQGILSDKGYKKISKKLG